MLTCMSIAIANQTVDTLRVQLRASRMRSGRDTATPHAQYQVSNEQSMWTQ